MVITFYMRNYKPSEIQFELEESKGELILLWLEKKAMAAHLRLD